MLTTFGGFVTNPVLSIAVTLCIFGLWNTNRVTAGYVMTGVGFMGTLYTLGTHGLSQRLLDYAKHMWDPELWFVPKFLASQSPTSLFLPGVAIICLVSAAIWSFVDAAYLYKYHDDHGKVGILPRIEAPGGSKATLPQV